MLALLQADRARTRRGLWATRCKCLPINDAAHRENVFDYIRKHEEKGAAIRCFAPAVPTMLDFDPNSLLI